MSTNQTTTGQTATLTSREWSNWTFIPGPDGAPYKAECRRAGVRPGTLERLTNWMGRDLRPHNHPWSFTSTVRSGWLEETIFEPVGDGTFRVQEVHIRKAGETYECPHGTIHMITDCAPGTQTHMVMEAFPEGRGAQDWESLTLDPSGLAVPQTAEEKAQATNVFLRYFKPLNTRPE